MFELKSEIIKDYWYKNKFTDSDKLINSYKDIPLTESI